MGLWAPSSSNTERREFRRTRLFKATGRLIGILMIDRGGSGTGLIFQLWFSWGLRVRLMQCLHHAYLEEFEKSRRD